METIDLDLSDVNELAFKLRIEGVSNGSVTARLYCESNEGHMHAFPGQFLGEPETVTFKLSRMENLVSEGVYPGWVEVVIDSKQFTPVKFNLKFKKPVSVQAESIQRENLQHREEPVVTMRAPTIVKKTPVGAPAPLPTPAPKATVSSTSAKEKPYKMNLKEWYKTQGNASSK